MTAGARAAAGPDSERVQGWALVFAARDGDREAFAELYRRHHVALYLIALRRVGDPRLAEDLVQETFLHAFRGLDKVRDVGSDVRGWLATILRNLAYDHHNSSRTRREVVGLPDDDVVAVDDPAGRVDTTIDAGALLRGPLRLLTDNERRCLVERHVHGLTPGQIAALSRTTPGAVKAATFRALRRLRTAIARAGAPRVPQPRSPRMRTRPVPFHEVRDEPIDHAAVQADDELLDTLAAGTAVPAPDDRAVAVLASWKAAHRPSLPQGDAPVSNPDPTKETRP